MGRFGNHRRAMPDEPSILGFSNPWYPEALTSARAVQLAPGLTIRVVSSVAFIATKYAAFRDSRRGGDFVSSRDLEDIVALVDGRPELDAELRTAKPELRKYLGAAFRDLLGERRFVEALPCHLPADVSSQGRLPRVLASLADWARQLE